MDFIRKNIKIIGLIGCAILIIANFLPFISGTARAGSVKETESVSLMHEEIRTMGIIAIVVEAILLLLVAKNKRKLAIIPVALILFFIIACRSVFSGESIDIGLGSEKIGYGIGFYAMIIGCILCLAFSFIKGNDGEKASTESK